jgi:hypothetical protein
MKKQVAKLQIFFLTLPKRKHPHDNPLECLPPLQKMPKAGCFSCGLATARKLYFMLGTEVLWHVVVVRSSVSLEKRTRDKRDFQSCKIRYLGEFKVFG